MAKTLARIFLLLGGSRAFLQPFNLKIYDSISHGVQRQSETFLGSTSDNETEHMASRRSILSNFAKATIFGQTVVISQSCFPQSANAAVGTLPEYSDTNAIVQGITVTVADKSQQDAMIQFLVDAFDFKVLRQSIIGTVTNSVSAVN